MTEYTATVESLTGEVVGINPNSLRYSRNLNKINECSFKINGLDTLTRQSVTEGSILKVYKNGTLDFEGVIIDKTQFGGGVMNIVVRGSEFQASKDNVFSTTLWQSTASATIFSSLIGDAVKWSAGTINTGVNIDFRVQDSDSVLNTIGNLRAKTGQDLYFDYLNKQISILDHQGSSTSVLSLIYESNIKNIKYKSSYPLGNDVKVWGKGDGSAQIVSESTSGQDASSKTTYGTIPYSYRDPTIISIDEANKLADSTVEYTKLPQKIYSFEVTDITLSTQLVEGDVVTIDAPEYDLSEEEVRIVSIERGFELDEEILVIQVTNKEYAKAQKKRNDLLAEIDKQNRDNQTYMQGTTNVLTFSEMINADSSAPLRVKASLPESFIQDEAGNLRVNSFTVDYDVDPFRSDVGTSSVSETNKNPTLSGSTNAEDTLELYDSTSLSITPGSSAWLFSVLSGLSLPTYSSDQFVQISVRISADENIPSGATGYTEFLLTDNNYANYQGQLSAYKGGIALSDGDFLLNQSYTLDDWSSGSCEYAIGTDVYGYDLYIEVEAYRGYRDHNHSSLSGNTALHKHDVAVSIGDDVSDAGSLNSTSVSIYIDYWNGSSWINKHSVLNTGKTLDTDVDISNGGTLPDAPGYWRTRIFTNSSTADLVQGIIKCKHELDT